MPNRLLRAGILTSYRVDALSFGAEVFYRRLMSVADDYGRADADWRILRSNLFPMKTELISEEQIEGWLAECTAMIPGEDEPLLHVYTVGRKKLLQINNFGQRLRSESKFPGPEREGEKEASPSNVRTPPPSADIRCSRAPTPTPPPTPPPTSHTTPTPTPPPTPDATSGNGNGFDYASRFLELVSHYPQEGAVRLEKARAVFVAAVRDECDLRGNTPIQAFRSMLDGIPRWKASELWQDGKIHSLRTYLAEHLWRESPLAAADSTRARARSPGLSKAAARRALIESATLEEKTADMPITEAIAKAQIERFADFAQFPETTAGVNELVRAFLATCRDAEDAIAIGDQLMRTMTWCPKPAEVYAAAESIVVEDPQPEPWRYERRPDDEPFNGIADLIDDRVLELLQRKATEGRTHAERESARQFLRLKSNGSAQTSIAAETPVEAVR